MAQITYVVSTDAVYVRKVVMLSIVRRDPNGQGTSCAIILPPQTRSFLDDYYNSQMSVQTINNVVIAINDSYTCIYTIYVYIEVIVSKQISYMIYSFEAAKSLRFVTGIINCRFVEFAGNNYRYSNSKYILCPAFNFSYRFKYNLPIIFGSKSRGNKLPDRMIQTTLCYDTLFINNNGIYLLD